MNKLPGCLVWDIDKDQIKAALEASKCNNFKEQFECTFEPDNRQIALHDRLQQYYDATPDNMPNYKALVHWRAFMRWAKAGGYSCEEVNRAKKEYYPREP